MVDGEAPPPPRINRTLTAAPAPERVALDLIRSVVGHAEGHEVEAVEKIRGILVGHGESVR